MLHVAGQMGTVASPSSDILFIYDYDSKSPLLLISRQKQDQGFRIFLKLL